MALEALANDSGGCQTTLLCTLNLRLVIGHDQARVELSSHRRIRCAPWNDPATGVVALPHRAGGRCWELANEVERGQAGEHLFPRPTMRESAECGLNMALHSKGDLHQGLLTTLGTDNRALSRNKRGGVKRAGVIEAMSTERSSNSSWPLSRRWIGTCAVLSR